MYTVLIKDTTVVCNACYAFDATESAEHNVWTT